MNFDQFPQVKKFDEKDGYDPEICNILNKAPNEIVDLIKNKKYYHVTLLTLGKKILEGGIKNNEKPIKEADLEYFETLYNKYSKNKNDHFLKYYIKTLEGSGSSGNRGVHVSDYPDTRSYQVPESLKFYLANLNFLLNSKILNSEEQMRTQQLFDSYYESVKSDKVAVLEISALDPALLNSVLGGFDDLDLSDPKDLDIIKTTIEFPNPNIKVRGNILPQYIKIKEEKSINTEYLDKGVKDSVFIIF